jgi:hypothetical protein
LHAGRLGAAGGALCRLRATFAHPNAYPQTNYGAIVAGQSSKKQLFLLYFLSCTKPLEPISGVDLPRNDRARDRRPSQTRRGETSGIGPDNTYPSSLIRGRPRMLFSCAQSISRIFARTGVTRYDSHDADGDCDSTEPVRTVLLRRSVADASRSD